MSFLPCILIPIYNHKESITATVGRLKPHGLPLLIVDDGSDEATQLVLQTLAQSEPSIKFYRLPVNGGKGAAVMHGLRQAQALGYSHALQIDADGQHDAQDVPKFIEAGREHPEAVVCGKPIYDSCVPKGRLYGRYITHVWVWIETLSFAVGDSMCGFRLYPLAESCALVNEVNIPKRMDFDIAVIVHLLWRGVPCINIPTRVIYPRDGVSHFDVLHDNLRISKMHTLLCLGMFWRFPRLMMDKFRSNAAHD